MKRFTEEEMNILLKQLGVSTNEGFSSHFMKDMLRYKKYGKFLRLTIDVLKGIDKNEWNETN